jgi:thiamine transport system ATP-binding protein
MLQVHGLTVVYGSTRAVDGVDLRVERGEVVCVLGPSGSGKSTMLRAIAGLERPDAGTVTWDGEDLTPLPPHRRQLGLMFQDHALFPHLDVAANVAFGLRMQHLPTDEVRTRVADTLELVNLEGFGARRIGELSGGEQQRVAVARALAGKPSIVWADEPTGNLDSEMARSVIELLDELHEEGLSLVLVTHDSTVAAHADRLITVRDGRLVADERLGKTGEEVQARQETAVR